MQLGGSAPLLLPSATAKFAVTFEDVDAIDDDRGEGIVAEKRATLPYGRGSILGTVRAHVRCKTCTEFSAQS